MWRALRKIQCPFFKHSPVHQSKKSATCTDTVSKLLPTILNHTETWCWGSRTKDQKRRDYRAREKGPFQQVKNEWLEAFGWSGVIFLGWYLTFPCSRRRITSNPAERYAFECLSSVSSPQYKSLVNCLTQFIIHPSNHVLPAVNAVKSKAESSSASTEHDEILKRSCDSLGAAHEKVTSSLNNWLGTESMRAGRHAEAFHYFSAAADSEDAAGIFNLGICYEMGYGTSQDFPTAAKLYRKASDLGHATAMYNLGVFHVHGWGGMEADGNEAHELFLAAARLGQVDARNALHWNEDLPSENLQQDTPPSTPEELSDTESMPLFLDTVVPKDNDLTDLWFRMLNIKLDNIKDVPFKSREVRLESNDSGINMSPTNYLISQGMA